MGLRQKRQYFLYILLCLIETQITANDHNKIVVPKMCLNEPFKVFQRHCLHALHGTVIRTCQRRSFKKHFTKISRSNVVEVTLFLRQPADLLPLNLGECFLGIVRILEQFHQAVDTVAKFTFE